jgi:hypothetical protein
VDTALLLLGLPICVADCRSFVIPNIYTKILFVVAIAHLSIFGFGDSLRVGISTAILAFLLVFKTGMGDIKLIGLILITHNFNAFDYLGQVFLLAMIHIVVCAGIDRKIPSKIPLAPSILIGLSTYLATR